jgi:hypothetical protein
VSSLINGYLRGTFRLRKTSQFLPQDKMMQPDPNQYSQVKILNNPVKSVTCRHKFTNSETVATCKIFKELLDLGQGVWQMCVQSVLIKNNTPNTKLNTVFDLKTNLSSSYKQVQGSAVAINETLTSLEFRCNFGDFKLISPAPKIFFTLNNRPNDSFKIFFSENELLSRAGSVYKVEVEIRFLFQRMI